jgi:hypothetical protein
MTALTYFLRLEEFHPSLQGPKANISELNSKGLYHTLNCLRTQSLDGCEWSCSSTPASMERGTKESYDYFDRMEPLAADLQEKMQNLYEECQAHLGSLRRMYAGAKQDNKLQGRIQEFQVSYEKAWGELIETVDGIQQKFINH